MVILETADEMRAWSMQRRCNGQQVGFVPTMGALHEGHASLVRQSVNDNGATAVSIFVNPTQFGPTEDYGRYPRTFDADCAICEELGAEAIYAPRANDLYPEDYSTYITVDNVSQGLCGASRPHFFRGVATVVTKLFNAVLPHRAYFGQKDAQQCAVINRMVRDLDMGIKIVEMPIVRETDGLAMSSRNTYLSNQERSRALALSKGLLAAKAHLLQGERDAAPVLDSLCRALAEVDIDYTALVDAANMRPVTHVDGPVLLAVAAQVGQTRLIDNTKFDPNTPMEGYRHAPYHVQEQVHRATVTQADLHYKGSMTLDADLMDAAGMLPYEQVDVYNINTGARFTTYLIEGERGSGVVCLNGAAARLGEPGDLIIAVTFAQMTPEEAREFKPTVVQVDENNRVAEVSTGP